MSKAKLLIFFKGFIFFIIGIYLSSKGVPSDPTSAVTYVGNEIIDSLNEVSDSEEVSNIAEDMKSNFSLWGFLIGLIGFLEMVGSGIALIKGY